VLFHLVGPSLALAESARVLHAGGRAGTIMRAWEHGPAAQTHWDQQSAGASMGILGLEAH